MAQHLIRRNGRYSYRQRIPADLIHAYKGKTEIVRALGTADPKDAHRAANKLAAELDDEFDRLRRDAQTGQRPHVVKYDRSLSVPLEAVEGAEESNLDRQIVEHDQRQAYLSDLEMVVRRVVGSVGSSSTAQLQSAPISPPEAHRQPSAVPAIGLPELIRLWEQTQKPASDTVARMHAVVAGFFEAAGRHNVKSVTRQHVLAYQAAELAKVAPSSARTKLAHLRALLQTAVNAGMIATNPASNVKTEVKQSARDSRQPFDKADLNAIFAGPVYTNGKRPKPGGGEAAYWLPILALFTGARLEELGQLSPTDVKQETYTAADGKEHSVGVLYITDEGEGQSLKNQASRRRVPLHQTLIKHGFMQYVSKQKGARLFPALIANKNGRETAGFSRWFGMYLRAECGITDKRKTFHSFRHAFKDSMREAGIAEDISDALSGHTNGSVSRNYGSSFYPLRPLVEAMTKYRISGVKLPQ